MSALYGVGEDRLVEIPCPRAAGPILEDIVGLGALGVRAVFEGHGLQIQEWGKVRTDFLTIREVPGAAPA